MALFLKAYTLVLLWEIDLVSKKGPGSCRITLMCLHQTHKESPLCATWGSLEGLNIFSKQFWAENNMVLVDIVLITPICFNRLLYLVKGKKPACSWNLQLFAMLQDTFQGLEMMFCLEEQEERFKSEPVPTSCSTQNLFLSILSPHPWLSLLGQKL